MKSHNQDLKVSVLDIEKLPGSNKLTNWDIPKHTRKRVFYSLQELFISEIK